MHIVPYPKTICSSLIHSSLTEVHTIIIITIILIIISKLDAKQLNDHKNEALQSEK